ncbi:C-glycoside deglycosidase beta subunit domain-containing protein [Microbacterium sp. 22215]|uniref:C-glycoside deglycosidase beta subunit domain-containing protein n=1 Tax=Microbacterium sp. 22215 TaxID=3453893 RepID=UPI003F85C872
MLEALRDDALTLTTTGYVVRLSLPWIRSLPLAALTDLSVEVDGEDIPLEAISVGERLIPFSDLAEEPGWWFVQDRVALHVDRQLAAGTHEVRVAFRLAVPYLQVGPDGPLVLPFLVSRELDTDTVAPATDVARDAA